MIWPFVGHAQPLAERATGVTFVTGTGWAGALLSVGGDC